MIKYFFDGTNYCNYIAEENANLQIYGTSKSLFALLNLSSEVI